MQLNANRLKRIARNQAQAERSFASVLRDPCWTLAIFGLAFVLASTTLATPLGAQFFGALQADRTTFPCKTLGGRHDWTDQLVRGGWRIQQHSQTCSHRLLDPDDRRQAIGSFQYCKEQLLNAQQRGLVCKNRPHVVVTLHGLAASRSYMGNMDSYLVEQGFDVVSFGYASTELSIEELTDSLECVVRQLEGVQQISFVGHSMGNLLVRHLLYRFQTCNNPPPITFGRMVMISPPNHGAELADTLGKLRIFECLLGPVVPELAQSSGWNCLQSQLATPWFEFGIIAGGKCNDKGYLRCVPDDDDGLLSIRTQYLEGATDYVQLGGLHQLMPHYEHVQLATVRFLQHGCF